MRDTLDGGTEPQGKLHKSMTWVMLKKTNTILFVFSSFWKLTFQGPISISSFHYEKMEKGKKYMSDFSWWLTTLRWNISVLKSDHSVAYLSTAQTFLSGKCVHYKILAWGLYSWLGPSPLGASWKMRVWISNTWAVFKQYVMASWQCVGFDKVTTHLVWV